MDPQIKTRWVTALRSGKYRQGKMYLYYNGAFDCFGVLADVLQVPYNYMHPTQHIRYYTFTVSRAHTHSSVKIPTNFCGIGRSQITKIWRMNDAGKSFSEMADWIEENL